MNVENNNFEFTGYRSFLVTIYLKNLKVSTQNYKIQFIFFIRRRCAGRNFENAVVGEIG